jgi:hypothetical protein
MHTAHACLQQQQHATGLPQHACLSSHARALHALLPARHTLCNHAHMCAAAASSAARCAQPTRPHTSAADSSPSISHSARVSLSTWAGRWRVTARRVCVFPVALRCLRGWCWLFGANTGMCRHTRTPHTFDTHCSAALGPSHHRHPNHAQHTHSPVACAPTAPPPAAPPACAAAQGHRRRRCCHCCRRSHPLVAAAAAAVARHQQHRRQRHAP